ncbi:MAG: hypothetical protein ACRBF0_00525 [Calditrichia bacterium]
MNTTIACNHDELLTKLAELNFHGPVKIAGQEFMIYHGQALAIPAQNEFTLHQFRMILREVDGLISKEEWQN